MFEPRRIILPDSFMIQLKDIDNTPIKLSNILCHLNIYNNNLSGGYFTYNFIPTNSDGIVILTREQIISNTELKNIYKQEAPLDDRPVRFDLSVLEKDFLTSFISSVDKYLAISDESTRKFLCSKGVDEEQIENEMLKIQARKIDDAKLKAFIKSNKNQSLEYSRSRSKITGEWTTEKIFTSDLIMQL